jgi:hypothetical protein
VRDSRVGGDRVRVRVLVETSTERVMITSEAEAIKRETDVEEQ